MHVDSIPSLPPCTVVGWTDEQIEELRIFYVAHSDGGIDLAGWCLEHGRQRSNTARKARSLGLTHQSRKRGRKPYIPGTKGHANIWVDHPHPRGFLGRHHSAEARAKISIASVKSASRMTPMEKAIKAAKMAETKIERYGSAGPTFQLSENPYSRTKGGRRADLENRYFRSGWEANYARILNLLLAQGAILSWEYEPQTFVFPGVTRGAITYTPDFRVTLPDGSVVFREVKGWLTARARMAMKRMTKHYPEVIIEMVDEPVYNELRRAFKGLVAWEGK